MKFQSQIKQLTALLSVTGLVVLLVFSPCKVRNSIQEAFDVTKTEVSNKNRSALKNGTCNVYSDVNSVISKANYSLQLSQDLGINTSQFNTTTIALSDRPIAKYYNARAEIPPLAPYYILFQNNKAYL
ncbi:hypothetical protein [Winogradskyella sp.]|uniref:hypothetical protein n=1 Tax=Winogradskyella sp. TaxID=1883156 RepID=UPI003AB1F20A